jgi:uncharacterized BrkB/YihY/UPF0761 family membrane protein
MIRLQERYGVAGGRKEDVIVSKGVEQVEETVRQAIQARGAVGPLSLSTPLWTGSQVLGATTKALNIAFDVVIPGIVEQAAPTLLLLAAFFLVYRFAARTGPDWHAALIGAMVVTVLFLFARPPRGPRLEACYRSNHERL